MKNGLIVTLIGILLLLKVVFKINISLNSTLLFLFSILFISDGLKILKKAKGEHFGSLIFGVFLALEGFKVVPQVNFWQLTLVLIASFMIGHGIYSIFFLKGSFLFSNKNGVTKNFEIPYNKTHESMDLNIDIDWTKMNLNGNSIESAIIGQYNSNNELYNMSLNYNENNINFKNKISVNSAKIPERANINFNLNKNINYFLNLALNVSDIFLDLRETKTKNIYISATASKIGIIPSNINDSVIDINLEISSLTIKLPRNVGIILNHSGELNFKTFEGLTKKENGSYISSNYNEAEYICHLTISSDISRLNVLII